MITGFWWGDLRERDLLEDPGFDGNIRVRWMWKKCYVSAWTRSIWLGQGQVAGTCKCGNEPLGSIKCREFLD